MDEHIERVMKRFEEEGRQGPHLVTVDLIYHLPDFRSVLQQFVWQAEDYLPLFPRVGLFLKHWRETLDAPIHSIDIIPGEALHRPIDIPLHGLLLDISERPLARI